MSKSTENRIGELESQLKASDLKLDEMKTNYDKLYRHAEETQRQSAYYQGQAENVRSEAPAESAQSEDTPYSDFTADGLDPKKLAALVEQVVESRVGPRLLQAEKYATDALQQTTGREIDRALQKFKEAHPESDRIMDFERLVLMDASDEIRKAQATGQQVGDLKELAVRAAKQRVETFNKWSSDAADTNRKRRESAKAKAMLPDVFTAAGFEEPPKAPETADEAGALLEQLVSAQAAQN